MFGLIAWLSVTLAACKFDVPVSDAQVQDAAALSGERGMAGYKEGEARYVFRPSEEGSEGHGITYRRVEGEWRVSAVSIFRDSWGAGNVLGSELLWHLERKPAGWTVFSSQYGVVKARKSVCEAVSTTVEQVTLLAERSVELAYASTGWPRPSEKSKQ